MQVEYFYVLLLYFQHFFFPLYLLLPVSCKDIGSITRVVRSALDIQMILVDKASFFSKVGFELDT